MSNNGFWIKAVPETATQAEVQFGSDKAAALVKSAILNYLSSFLKKDGKNRRYIPAAFPTMDVYLSDEVKQNAVDDPSKKFLKLSALYERVKETLPCILLDDQSVTFKPAGLGALTGTSLIRESTKLWFHSVRDVTVSIIIGANDLTTCTNIRDSVSIMLGDICKFICGNILLNDKDDHSSWQVILNTPNQQDLGSIERIPAGTGESANNFVYFSQNTVSCRFESSYAIQIPATSHFLTEKTWDMSVLAPDEVRLGESGDIKIVNARPFGLRLFVSDENIALLNRTSPTTFKLLGRKRGTVTLQLLDETCSVQERINPVIKVNNHKELFSKDITII